jgi:MFS family permease
MDQTGAMLGPLVVTAVLYWNGSYRIGFAVLLIPALLTFSVLVAARFLYPRPQELELRPPNMETAGLPRAYWRYLIAASLVAAGYADFSLIGYHFEKTAAVVDAWIPIFYAVAMGTDALAALVLGALFDRTGIPVLAAVTGVSALFAPLVFGTGFYPALLGMALWGIGMGAQESIMRAAVANMAPAHRRGSAYGIFNAGYGVAWFAGSALMGLLYDRSVRYVILFSVVTQLAAVPLFLRLRPQRER